MSNSVDEVAIRRATHADLPAILTLGQRSLGWEGGSGDEAHFRWKHFENPVGESPMWVAEVGGSMAGFRTFLRWEFVGRSGEIHHAVRAVDTATDPAFQGRGIFTKLTLGALDEMRAEGVDFVFNTPNDQSRPGYLNMGWQVIGRVPIAVRPTGFAGILRTVRARTPATRGAIATTAGKPAAEVFADCTTSEALVGLTPPGPGLATHRTPSYLAWRYGPAALQYRVVAAPAGFDAGAAVFHLRRRGPATEAVICELFVAPGDRQTARAVCQRIVAEAGADYLIRVRSPGRPLVYDRFWAVPRLGPILTGRALGGSPPPDPAGWRLTLGDIELF